MPAVAQWRTDRWYVSPHNFRPESPRIEGQVTITDCTLRDGEQMAGIVFTKEDKVKIARKLDEAHIHQIEAGMPAVSNEDYEAVKAIAREKLTAQVYALSRATKADVDMVLSCDVPGIQISMPAGELQLKYKLKWSEERVISTAIDIVDYSKSHGLWVNLSPYDTTRADMVFLERYVKSVVKETAVDRIRLVDTVGGARPSAIAFLTRTMKSWMGSVPLEVHCHNDFGLAVANSLAGLEAGASAVSTTVNGIGERVGNAPTEELVLALLVLYGIDTGIDYSKLVELSTLVQKLSGVRLQQHKPVVGEGAFSHESGLSVDGILELPWTGEAFSPELVGQSRRIVLGKKSGKKSIDFVMSKYGITLPEEDTAILLKMVKEEAIKTKKLVPESRLVELSKQLLETNRSGKPLKPA